MVYLLISPLAFGALSGKYLGGQFPESSRFDLFEGFRRYVSGSAVTAIEKYVALANKIGITPSQLAISFTLSRGFLTSSIIGATNLNQLEENIKSSEITLSQETLQEIEAIHSLDSNPNHS